MSTCTVALASATQNHGGSGLPQTLLESQNRCTATASQKGASNVAANLDHAQKRFADFSSGNVNGFLAGVAEDVKGCMLESLAAEGQNIQGKSHLAEIVSRLQERMMQAKCTPYNWRAVKNDVLCNIDWEFIALSGEPVTMCALARIVLENSIIREIYLIADTDRDVDEQEPPTVKRSREVVAHLAAGNYEQYLAMVHDGAKGSLLGGLLQGADAICNKSELKQILDNFDTYMDIKRFEPCNFRALPNNDVMYNVEWEFIWKPSGKFVTTTAIVRDVFHEEMLVETFHMVDVKHMSRGWYHM